MFALVCLFVSRFFSRLACLEEIRGQPLLQNCVCCGLQNLNLVDPCDRLGSLVFDLFMSGAYFGYQGRPREFQGRPERKSSEDDGS